MLTVNKNQVYEGYDKVVAIPEGNSLSVLLSHFNPVARVKVGYLRYCFLYQVTDRVCIINSIGGSAFGKYRASRELCSRYDRKAWVEQLRYADDADFALHQRNMNMILFDFTAEVLKDGSH